MVDFSNLTVPFIIGPSHAHRFGSILGGSFAPISDYPGYADLTGLKKSTVAGRGIFSMAPPALLLNVGEQ